MVQCFNSQRWHSQFVEILWDISHKIRFIKNIREMLLPDMMMIRQLAVFQPQSGEVTISLLD